MKLRPHFPNSHLDLTIAPVHRIEQIDICAGWAIHSICTTYSERVHQGYQARLQSVLRNSVVLNNNETVSQISGFVGSYPYCNQNLLIQLQLVIFDTQSGAIRVAGVPSFLPDPACLSQQHSHLVAVMATPRAGYSVSNPTVLAGFETADNPQSLSIIKNSNRRVGPDRFDLEIVMDANNKFPLRL
ncbi:hypothetical protein B0H14DRAFT_3504799 [Mycena olivaceomarginata]|nr:hypothetical protein B0H14DRAFT_3504799 [Mycena olivaceomarginata]